MGNFVAQQVIEDLQRKGFFIAPASIRHHGGYEGALFDHSYEVAKALVNAEDSAALVCPLVLDSVFLPSPLELRLNVKALSQGSVSNPSAGSLSPRLAKVKAFFASFLDDLDALLG